MEGVWFKKRLALAVECIKYLYFLTEHDHVFSCATEKL